MEPENNIPVEKESIIWSSQPNKKVWYISNFISNTFLALIVGLMTYFIFIAKFFGQNVETKAIIFLMLLYLPLLVMVLWRYYLLFGNQGFPEFSLTSGKNVMIESKRGGIDTPISFGKFPGGKLQFNINEIIGIKVKQRLFQKLLGEECRTIYFKLGLKNKFSDIFSDLWKGQKISDAVFSINNEGIPFDSLDNYNDFTSKIFNEGTYEVFNSSLKGRFVISLLKDLKTIPILIFLILPTLFIFLLRNGTISGSIKAPYFLDIAFYILLGVVFILVIRLNVFRTMLFLYSPSYHISESTLRVYNRRLKIYTELPYQEYNLNRIKKVWKIKVIGDKVHNSFLLGLSINEEFDMNSIIANVTKQSVDFVLVLSISNPDKFLSRLGIKPEITEFGSFEQLISLYKILK